MVTTNSATEGGGVMANILRCISPAGKFFPVGRLDKNTTGLLLLTNDGQLSQNITAASCCEKEYWCAITQRRDADMALRIQAVLPKLLEGVTLQCPEKHKSYEAKARSASVLQVADIPSSTLEAGLGGENHIYVSLTVATGQFHVIKKMLAEVETPLVALHRERIGPMSLAALNLTSPGTYVELSCDEVEELRSHLANGVKAV